MLKGTHQSRTILEQKDAAHWIDLSLASSFIAASMHSMRFTFQYNQHSQGSIPESTVGPHHYQMSLKRKIR